MSKKKRVLSAVATIVVGVVAALAVFLVTRPDGGTSVARAATSGGEVTTTEADRSPDPEAAVPSTTPEPSATASAPSSTPPVSAEPTPGPAPVSAAPTPSPSATVTEVSVTVAYHGWSWVDDVAQVGAAIKGDEKPGGTCTLTMTREGRSVTGTAPATREGDGTVCAAVSVTGDQLTAGMWKAVLSYSSPGHQGTAAAVDIEVVK